jgi:hypothetical protein
MSTRAVAESGTMLGYNTHGHKLRFSLSKKAQFVTECGITPAAKDGAGRDGETEMLEPGRGRRGHVQGFKVQQQFCQSRHGICTTLLVMPFRQACVHRLAVGGQLQTDQSPVTDADDVAGVGIDRAARLQRA